MIGWESVVGGGYGGCACERHTSAIWEELSFLTIFSLNEASSFWGDPKACLT